MIPQPSSPVSVAPTRCVPRDTSEHGLRARQHPTAVTPTLTLWPNSTAPSVSRPQLPLRPRMTLELPAVLQRARAVPTHISSCGILLHLILSPWFSCRCNVSCRVNHWKKKENKAGNIKKKRRHITCNAQYLVQRVTRAIPLSSSYSRAHIAASLYTLWITAPTLDRGFGSCHSSRGVRM
jgi:hypothetical protein